MNLKTFLTFLFLTFASFLLSTVPHIASGAPLLPPRDGSIECGDLIGGCGPGTCCSKYGYCGTGVAYCGYPAPSDACGGGPPYTGEGICCSVYGYCGSGPDYCVNRSW